MGMSEGKEVVYKYNVPASNGYHVLKYANIYSVATE